VLRAGTSAETPYHKPHLPSKPGFWCFQGGDKKFFVTERFISTEEISVIEALTQPDSPLVLRAENESAVRKTLVTLRKLSASLSANTNTIHTRAHGFLVDDF
jgi:hypothetical protein